MKRHLQCAEQQISPSNLIKYCAVPGKVTTRSALSSSQMKRHLHCAEQQMSPSNLTKHCHERWFACLTPVTTWNVIYNVRGNKWHYSVPHQSIEPATQMTRMFDPRHSTEASIYYCAEQQVSPSNQSCACHYKMTTQNLTKFAQNSWSVHLQCAADP